jgi:DHA1 family tetracycline resistance protein-like MFS transporter
VQDSLKTTRLTVFLIVLLDIMGLGLIIPAQPFLAKSFGADAITITQLGTIYSFMQFVLGPVWGSLSDRFGRRPVLLTTLLITMSGHIVFALAGSLMILFVARGMVGIGAANISTAQAVLSDTHPPAERSRAMALVGAAFGLGFVLGPALGGILFHIDQRAPAGLAAMLALVNMVLVSRCVGETRPVSLTSSPSAHRVGLRSLLKADGSLRPLIMTTLFMMTAFALMEQSIGLFIESAWVPDGAEVGMKEATKLTSIFLVVVGITAIFVQGFLVRRWLTSTPETALLRGGLVIIAITLALIPCLGWYGSYALFLVSGALLALGSGMFNPSMAGLVSLSCPPDKQGIGLAINQSAFALGRIIGPLVAGALFACNRNIPFITGSALTLVALALASRVRAAR